MASFVRRLFGGNEKKSQPAPAPAPKAPAKAAAPAAPAAQVSEGKGTQGKAAGRSYRPKRQSKTRFTSSLGISMREKQRSAQAMKILTGQ